MASAVSRGFDDIDSLTEPSDLLRFTGYMRQTYQAFIMEWVLSRESVDVIEFEERMARLFIPRGGRQYYSSTGRAIVRLRSAELLDMFDDLYETYEGNPVPAQFKNLCRTMSATIIFAYYSYNLRFYKGDM